ncbi:MAG: hypothetical protein ABIK15_10490 [Pseudomonadota bacterium]
MRLMRTGEFAKQEAGKQPGDTIRRSTYDKLLDGDVFTTGQIPAAPIKGSVCAGMYNVGKKRKILHNRIMPANLFYIEEEVWMS